MDGNAENITAELISAQLALVRIMQESAGEAIARNDWQNADRITNIIDRVFGTFLRGIQVMSIDVSALKNALSSLGSVNPDLVKQLQDGLAAQSADISDIKNALAELNAAAGGSTPTPVPPPAV